MSATSSGAFMRWFRGCRSYQLKPEPEAAIQAVLRGVSPDILGRAKQAMDDDFMSGKLNPNRVGQIDVRRALRAARNERGAERTDDLPPCPRCGRSGYLVCYGAYDSSGDWQDWRAESVYRGENHPPDGRVSRVLKLCRCGRLEYRPGRTPPLASEADEEAWDRTVAPRVNAQPKVWADQRAVGPLADAEIRLDLLELAGLEETETYRRCLDWRDREQRRWAARGAA